MTAKVIFNDLNNRSYSIVTGLVTRFRSENTSPGERDPHNDVMWTSVGTPYDVIQATYGISHP